MNTTLWQESNWTFNLKKKNSWIIKNRLAWTLWFHRNMLSSHLFWGCIWRTGSENRNWISSLKLRSPKDAVLDSLFASLKNKCVKWISFLMTAFKPSQFQFRFPSKLLLLVATLLLLSALKTARPRALFGSRPFCPPFETCDQGVICTNKLLTNLTGG